MQDELNMQLLKIFWLVSPSVGVEVCEQDYLNSSLDSQLRLQFLCKYSHLQLHVAVQLRYGA